MLRQKSKFCFMTAKMLSKILNKSKVLLFLLITQDMLIIGLCDNVGLVQWWRYDIDITLFLWFELFFIFLTLNLTRVSSVTLIVALMDLNQKNNPKHWRYRLLVAHAGAPFRKHS